MCPTVAIYTNTLYAHTFAIITFVKNILSIILIVIFSLFFKASTCQREDQSDDANTSINSSSCSSNEDSPKKSRRRTYYRTSNASMTSTSSLSSNLSCSSTLNVSRSSLTRRQKKNKKIDMSSDEKENRQRKSCKTNTIIPRKRPTTTTLSYTMSEIHRTRALTPPLKEAIKLNLPEHELANILRSNYILNESDLLLAGFPQMCSNNMAFIYMPDHFSGSLRLYTTEPTQILFDVNAAVFIPNNAHHSQDLTNRKPLVILNKDDGLVAIKSPSSVSGDSGQGSGTSSPSSISEVDSSDDTEIKDERSCCRCKIRYDINENNLDYSKFRCSYHPGKPEMIRKSNSSYISAYTCCNKPQRSSGCEYSRCHVWTGLEEGYNGPYTDFVTTQEPNYLADDNNYGVYALDCEMCYTQIGLEVTKVSVINSGGRLVYEKLIKPLNCIIDYNTRFSGITEKSLSSRSVKRLHEVQTDLLKIINSKSILIGHAINNDLRVLKIIHKNVIDTSLVFPHPKGLPYRLSLKHIVKSYLHRDIQSNDQGHCSFEDSRACLEALLWNVRRNYRSD